MGKENAIGSFCAFSETPIATHYRPFPLSLEEHRIMELPNRHTQHSIEFMYVRHPIFADYPGRSRRKEVIYRVNRGKDKFNLGNLRAKIPCSWIKACILRLPSGGHKLSYPLLSFAIGRQAAREVRREKQFGDLCRWEKLRCIIYLVERSGIKIGYMDFVEGNWRGLDVTPYSFGSKSSSSDHRTRTIHS